VIIILFAILGRSFGMVFLTILFSWPALVGGACRIPAREGTEHIPRDQKRWASATAAIMFRRCR
jgi:hypothetical protein